MPKKFVEYGRIEQNTTLAVLSVEKYIISRLIALVKFVRGVAVRSVRWCKKLAKRVDKAKDNDGSDDGSDDDGNDDGSDDSSSNYDSSDDRSDYSNSSSDSNE